MPTFHWISAAAYAPPANELAGYEDAVIAYMNTEHARAWQGCCRFFHDRETARAIMVGIDGDGFDLCGNRLRPAAW
ncbi:MAG: DUF2470 domain-containing protein [Betaproteobacteria bacterium]|nr:DUF2470 domain-containing protein [Betaproteobacteria bacterium]MDH3437312.1 DUF2470 domain-containing protein [Betaproteobacteria bacterium]